MARPTPQAARAGGLAVRAKESPEACPHCGQPMNGRAWHSFLGHLGLHGLANNHFNGDIHAAQERLRRNGLAKQDPFPENGAFQPYRPVTDHTEENHD